MGVAVLDTSVVIGAIDIADALHARSVSAIRSARRRHDLTVPAVVFAEALVGARLAGGEAVDWVETFVRGAPVAVFTVDMARRAADIRARHRLPLPDAMIIGTAIELSAAVILTAYRRWKEIDARVQVV